MLAADPFQLLKVGQGAGDLQQAVGGPQRQGQSFAGGFQPGFVGRGQFAMAAQPRKVEKGVGAALTGLLALAGFGHALGCCGGIVTGYALGIERRGFPRHGQVQVDTVEQRTGQLVAIPLHHVRRAAAAPAGLAEISTGARVHGRDQLEARWKAHAIPGTRNHDVSRLEGLPQDFQDLSVELRYFAV